MEYLLFFAAVLILYIDLGLQGGLGQNKKFKLPPISTPEGKRDTHFWVARTHSLGCGSRYCPH